MWAELTKFLWHMLEKCQFLFFYHWRWVTLLFTSLSKEMKHVCASSGYRLKCLNPKHMPSQKRCVRETGAMNFMLTWSDGQQQKLTASSSKEQAVNSLVPSFMLWTPKYRQGLCLSPEGLTSPHTPKSCLPLMPLELYLFGFVKQCGRLKWATKSQCIPAPAIKASDTDTNNTCWESPQASKILKQRGQHPCFVQKDVHMLF